MSSIKTVYVTSENLIKDLAFKQRLGLKADLIDEVVSVIEYAVEKSDNKTGVKIDQDQVRWQKEFIFIKVFVLKNYHSLNNI